MKSWEDKIIEEAICGVDIGTCSDECFKEILEDIKTQVAFVLNNYDLTEEQRELLIEGNAEIVEEKKRK